jgi:ATP-dependent DNA ligase
MLRPPVEPMLARAVEQLPRERALSGGCAYEPKFDGYRALLFVTSDGCVVQSRRGKDITAAFPDIAAAAVAQLPADMVIDGELVILGDRGVLDFTALQHRIAAPRQARALAATQPASFAAFDVLWCTAQGDLRKQPYAARRAVLEQLLSSSRPPLQLVPQTTSYDVATGWMRQYAVAAVGLEGVVVKGRADRYAGGRRGWLKVRVRHTAEAIVGAVTGTLGSPERLVLGRVDEAGDLAVVGVTTALSTGQRRTVAAHLHEPMGTHPWPRELPSGRFGDGRMRVLPVDPVLVVEISADNADGHGRWRHLTRLVRIRPDLAPEDVPTAEQI